MSGPLRPRLHEAALRGNLSKINQYITAGDIVNSPDAAGRTPLLFATLGGQVDAVELLLSKGADPLARDREGFFPFYFAAGSGELAVVKMILAAGANLNDVVGRGGQGTALSIASAKGWKEIVQFLLDNGCDIEKRAVDGKPPLVDALLDGQMEVFKMLIAAGADVNAVRAEGVTPLHECARRDHHAFALELVRNGASVDVLDTIGHSPLHDAAFMGSHKVLQLLCESGADYNRTVDESMKTPLHLSSSKGHDKCVYQLLCAGAIVSPRDSMGFTPLHYSAEWNFVEVIEHLLSAGANCSILDNNQQTPLALASGNGHVAAVTLLLDAGSKPNDLISYGRTAMFVASTVHVVKVLVNRGGSVNVLDNGGRSVPHSAGVLGADAGVICALYKAGAVPTLKDKWGATAADLAREAGNDDAAKLLDLLAAKHASMNST